MGTLSWPPGGTARFSGVPSPSVSTVIMLTDSVSPSMSLSLLSTWPAVDAPGTVVALSSAATGASLTGVTVMLTLPVPLRPPESATA
jgi:hypothetical protein